MPFEFSPNTSIGSLKGFPKTAVSFEKKLKKLFLATDALASGGFFVS